LEIEHVYAEFDGTHSGIDWRYDNSLPSLAKALYKSSSTLTSNR